MRVINGLLGIAFFGLIHMDAYSSETTDLSFSSSAAPVLVVASSGLAMRRAEETIDASGLRIGARLSVEEALARIKVQPAATAIWLELDRDCGDPMDDLLIHVSHDVSRGFYGAVVSATKPLLDKASARITNDDVELIVEADEAERTTALALAIVRKQSALKTHDIGADKSAERLRQLSEEVSRIASTLARLSADPVPNRASVAPMVSGDVPSLSADVVGNVIRARRLRAKFFPDELFADPAWDMLLDLLQSEIRQLRVPVSNLCIAASVPATTALRWLKTLVSQGLFLRRPDPHDGRRVFIELAPETSLAMRRYFGELGPVAVI